MEYFSHILTIIYVETNMQYKLVQERRLLWHNLLHIRFRQMRHYQRLIGQSGLYRKGLEPKR